MLKYLNKLRNLFQNSTSQIRIKYKVILMQAVPDDVNAITPQRDPQAFRSLWLLYRTNTKRIFQFKISSPRDQRVQQTFHLYNISIDYRVKCEVDRVTVRQMSNIWKCKWINVKVDQIGELWPTQRWYKTSINIKHSPDAASFRIFICIIYNSVNFCITSFAQTTINVRSNSPLIFNFTTRILIRTSFRRDLIIFFEYVYHTIVSPIMNRFK